VINYDPFSRPPRRRNGRAVLATVVIVLVVGGLAVLVMGRRGAAGGQPSSPAAASSAAGRPAAAAAASSPPVTATAGQLTLGACIDPTGSIVSSFAPAIRGDLARAVGSLAPPAGQLPTTADGGGAITQPQSGVNLTVRQVTTNSYSSTLGAYTRTVVVPPVPGLATSRPAPNVPDYLAQLRTWTTGYDTVAAARQAAGKAATAGAAAIAGMPLDRLGHSAISACIAGLLTTMPAGGTHSYLLASDLEENETPQLAGSFHGAPLTIIQTCDSGNAGYCQGLLDHFTGLMHQLDVGRITVSRPEMAAAAISQWIRSGEVTP